MTAVVLMATPCTKSLRGGNGGHLLVLILLYVDDVYYYIGGKGGWEGGERERDDGLY